MKATKHFFKLTCVAAFMTAGIFTLALFNKEKASATDSYTINVTNNSGDVSMKPSQAQLTKLNP